MEFRRAESLDFIGLLQLVEHRSGVNSYDEGIIGVRSDIILASLAPPQSRHPGQNGLA